MDKQKVVISLFILFIMVSSVFGLVFFYVSPPQPPLEYDGFKFTVLQNGLETKIDGEPMVFFFFPADLLHIQLSEDVRSELAKPVWTVTYDPSDERNASLAEAQYYLEYQLAGKKMIERGLTESFESLPVRSCADATAEQPVVLLSFGEMTEVSVENNCVVVSAVDDLDLFRSAELMIYHVLGVVR